MSEAELAAVVALDLKANELHLKHHHARCIEKRVAAVAAAQALGFEDCLITAFLQMILAGSCVTQALAPGVTDAEVRNGGIGRASLLLRSVFPTLHRRKAAGTLLAGKCRPVEVAWFTAKHIAACSPMTAWRTHLIGYDAYLYAAAVSLVVIMVAPFDNLELAQFALTAVDLMTRPREYSDKLLSAEFRFVHQLQNRLSMPFVRNSPAGELLAEALRRLERSGVLRERGIDEAVKQLETAPDHDLILNDAVRVQAREADALRSCALETCGAKEEHLQHFKRCSACKAVVYCCKEHQVQDWPAHKAACKAARKAAAEAAGGAPGPRS